MSDPFTPDTNSSARGAVTGGAARPALVLAVVLLATFVINLDT